MRVGIVVPHMFMHRDILPRVIFSPGVLALELVEGLQQLGAGVTLFTPGPADTSATNLTADLTYFEQELAGRGDTYLELLKKHPLTFITLARQVQSEIIARAFDMANRGQLDVVHIYTNEEDTALPFAKLCTKPVVFTHHDPFSFLVKYKHVFPKYKQNNWISMSLAQRGDMPTDTNWVANIYHGLAESALKPNYKPAGRYVAYLGRIIQSKGVHLAIAAVQSYNKAHPDNPYTLKIAGKHYAEHGKDSYWQTQIEPQLGEQIEYVGFIDNIVDKQKFLGNAAALIVPSTFAEPFGMVLIEALACGTPLIGLDSGAIPEIIKPGQTGLIAQKDTAQTTTVSALVGVLENVETIGRKACRADFKERFTLDRMCREHLAVYERLSATRNKLQND